MRCHNGLEAYPSRSQATHPFGRDALAGTSSNFRHFLGTADSGFLYLRGKGQGEGHQKEWLAVGEEKNKTEKNKTEEKPSLHTSVGL
jgi:hypothetical protein